jgi:AraC family transcriptional regulator, regulatory protein of adaptative response / methylated-DNA-[protein]-cysteine methyltransferase
MGTELADVDFPLYLTFIDSPVGKLIGGATAKAVVLLEFTDDAPRETVIETLARRFERPVSEATNPHLMLLEMELAGYFAGMLRQFSVPVAYEGSPFQREVWGELLKIPYGKTRSYQDLANALGMPNATRAVGHANGQNHIAIVIPCHRVVNSGGALGGYAGGLWRKRYLLDLEFGQQGLGF